MPKQHCEAVSDDRGVIGHHRAASLLNRAVDTRCPRCDEEPALAARLPVLDGVHAITLPQHHDVWAQLGQPVTVPGVTEQALATFAVDAMALVRWPIWLGWRITDLAARSHVELEAIVHQLAGDFDDARLFLYLHGLTQIRAGSCQDFTISPFSLASFG